jgi:hypothetical protein
MTAKQALALAIQASAPITALENAILQNPDYIIMYGRKFPRHPWPSAERVILASNDVARMVEYAKSVVRGRWPDAEPSIAKHSDEGLHAKYASCLSVAEIDEAWAAGCPCWLETYAEKVIEGKLPEHLHNRMLLFGLDCRDSPCMKRYLRNHP